MLPVLTTSHLTLRAATEADLETFWHLLSDPEVCRYLCDDRVPSRAEVEELLAKDIAGWPAGLGLWLAHDREQTFIGCVGLHPVSEPVVVHLPDLEDQIEIMVALVPAQWRRGYASEALAVLMTYAFETLRLERLIALVDEPNVRSHRLMIRLGFAPGETSPGPRYRLRSYRLDRAAFVRRQI